MADHITFDSMGMDVIYECRSYRTLYASGGYYYITQMVQVNINTSYIMVLTDECIYNKIEKFRLGAPSFKFSFKKTSVNFVNNSTNIIIVIVGDNDTVTLK